MCYIDLCCAVGTLIVAWMCTKVTEPLRLAATIAVVPKIASVLSHRHEEQEHMHEEEERAKERESQKQKQQ